MVFVSNLHEETGEEDLVELFMDAGAVKNSYLNLDRRTGFCKGYALIEYEKQQEAQVGLACSTFVSLPSSSYLSSTYTCALLKKGW